MSHPRWTPAEETNLSRWVSQATSAEEIVRYFRDAGTPRTDTAIFLKIRRAVRETHPDRFRLDSRTISVSLWISLSDRERIVSKKKVGSRAPKTPPASAPAPREPVRYTRYEDSSDWLTASEAARVLGISSKRVRDVLRSGRVPSLLNTARRWLVAREAIEEYNRSRKKSRSDKGGENPFGGKWVTLSAVRRLEGNRKTTPASLKEARIPTLSVPALREGFNPTTLVSVEFYHARFPVPKDQIPKLLRSSRFRNRVEQDRENREQLVGVFPVPVPPQNLDKKVPPKTLEDLSYIRMMARTGIWSLTPAEELAKVYHLLGVPYP